MLLKSCNKSNPIHLQSYLRINSLDFGYNRVYTT